MLQKRRYWPKHVPGDEIIQHFAEKDIGDADMIKGTMEGIPFYIHAMKEPDYVMMLVLTYGMLLSMGETKKWHFTVDGVKKVAKFKYPEIINNCYKFQDMINNHNSFWMHPISMEETWMTMRWANCVFCFLLAVMMINVQNTAVYFLNKPKLDALQSH